MSCVWGGFAFALVIPNLKLAVPYSNNLLLAGLSRNNLKLAVASYIKKEVK